MSLHEIEPYLKQIRDHPRLTREEEIELANLIAKGDEKAKHRLIECNLRLVVSIAKSKARPGCPIADLIAEGNLGLIVAAAKFRADKGAKFSTYAAWWIKQHIQRALHKNTRLIYVPVQVTRRTAHAKATSEALAQEYGREPTEEELQQELKLTDQQFSRVQAAWHGTISLQTKVGGKTEEDGQSLEEIVPDESAVNAHGSTEIAQMRDVALQFLPRLKEKEQEILIHRFGLCNYTAKTLEQTSEHLGITRERVRQIQNKTLLKMRKWMQQEKLRAYRFARPSDDEEQEE